MSAVEILAELPKLTDDERDEVQFLHETADAMFRDMDKFHPHKNN